MMSSGAESVTSSQSGRAEGSISPGSGCGSCKEGKDGISPPVIVLPHQARIGYAFSTSASNLFYIPLLMREQLAVCLFAGASQYQRLSLVQQVVVSQMGGLVLLLTSSSS
jgi:hypothetical protein